MSSRSQVASAAWIEALLNQALRPEVGVVGCLMHGREERVTHAGYELLVSGQVQGVLLGVSRFAPEPVLGLAQVRSCQAVSDDCLMVRKDLFSQCGGMQAVAGADIDLCLRAAQAGLLVIWTPQAQCSMTLFRRLGNSNSRHCQRAGHRRSRRGWRPVINLVWTYRGARVQTSRWYSNGSASWLDAGVTTRPGLMPGLVVSTPRSR